MSSGGKVHGQRRIVEGTPAFDRSVQTGVPRLRFTARGGRRADLLSNRFIERSGRYVCGSRLTKSKMPWRPGLAPVAKVDHATGVCAGVVVRSRAYPPADL